MSEDIRWLQRLQSFSEVQAQLDEAMALMQARPVKTGKAGCDPGIRVHLRARLEHPQGLSDLARYPRHRWLKGCYPRSVQQRPAGRWVRLDGGLVDRNRTSHIYNEETAAVILQSISSSIICC
jgi:hypothetical protein